MDPKGLLSFWLMRGDSSRAMGRSKMGMIMSDTRILAIMPAYNESGNIGPVVREMKALGRGIDVLVIDDGSKDRTAQEAADAGARVISLPFNLGIGAAVQTGFLYAALNGYAVACQVDGDGQHDPKFLRAIIDPVLDGRADMTVGSRFIGPDTGWKSSFFRRVGIRFFAALISFLTGFEITDPTSGFRAVSAKTIKIFSRDYPSDFPEPESIMNAKRFGLSVLEVPVQMRKRVFGHSSIRYIKTLYYMVKVTLAIMLSFLKRNVTTCL